MDHCLCCWAHFECSRYVSSSKHWCQCKWLGSREGAVFPCLKSAWVPLNFSPLLLTWECPVRSDLHLHCSWFRKVFTLFSHGTHEAHFMLVRNEKIAATFLQACWVPWQWTYGLIIHLSRWLQFYLIGLLAHAWKHCLNRQSHGWFQQC